MILFELTQSEQHSAYQDLEIANGNRQYDFIRSLVIAALAVQRTFLSQTIIKALNFHAIACLHTHAAITVPVKSGSATTNRRPTSECSSLWTTSAITQIHTDAQHHV